MNAAETKAIMLALKARFASKPPKAKPPQVLPGKTPAFLSNVNDDNDEDDTPLSLKTPVPKSGKGLPGKWSPVA